MTTVAAPVVPVAPAPDLDARDLDARVRVYVWQVPVRIAHWLLFGSITSLSVTGIYIADPFLAPAGGGVMTTIRAIHIVSALVLLVSGAIRTASLLVGNRWARWYAFIPTNRYQLTELFRQAGFYAFVRREIPKVIGHNQLAAAAYVVLFLLLLVEVITGFALDGLLGTEPMASLFWWLRELMGPQALRLVHHLAMWGILAIALFHVYSCVLVDNVEKVGILTSMVNGYKYPTRAEVLESRDGGPDVLAEAEAAEAADARRPHRPSEADR
jgi:Ni/Fe-hydrogenase 1 B-type cytochrome subunit